MDNVGHIYVLANSAMPGLVKIGKTTRSPNDRAAELSSATGLPTPFIVVYEQLFDDCSAAESFVHTYLATKGFRVTDNREFFNAPVNDVVRAIALAPGSIDGSSTQAFSETAREPITQIQPDELDDLSFGAVSSAIRAPWESVYEDAENHYLGLGDVLEDYQEAMRLYQQAANLGSLPAFSMIGAMHALGEGVHPNQENAMKYFKEGARRGNWHCYWALGMLFFAPNSPDRTGVNLQNAEKCFRLFLDKWSDRVVDANHFTISQLQKVDSDCSALIFRKVNNGIEAPPVLRNFFLERSEHIEVAAQGMVDHCNKRGDSRFAGLYQSVVDYLRQIRE